MTFAVIFKPSAEKQLLVLPEAVQRRILDTLDSLVTNPRSGGALKLAGASQAWRVRIGDYRAVYEIQQTAKTIFVTIVAHRREVYRDV